MSEHNNPAPGSFCWAELGTSDPDSAKSFYRSLLKWEFEGQPLSDGMVYYMARSDGRDVAGIYKLTSEMVTAGVPPNWLPYVIVDDCDAAEARAVELGGTVLAPSLDVMDLGRAAVVQDPVGAIIGLWQPQAFAGTGPAETPGSTCWFELNTRDEAAARDFYIRLFGWGAREQKMEALTYTTFTNGEQDAGGMMMIPQDAAQMPSQWLTYFAVEQCDAAAETVRKGGGRVLLPPTDIPGIGRFSVISDPQGAVSAIFQLGESPG